MTVIAGTGVASDSVTDELAAGAGRDELGAVGEVANDGDPGDRARGGSAEGTGTEGGAAHEKRGRHCGV